MKVVEHHQQAFRFGRVVQCLDDCLVEQERAGFGREAIEIRHIA
jgi:hypothetical protein